MPYFIDISKQTTELCIHINIFCFPNIIKLWVEAIRLGFLRKRFHKKKVYAHAHTHC